MRYAIFDVDAKGRRFYLAGIYLKIARGHNLVGRSLEHGNMRDLREQDVFDLAA
jgi:hypothetical protein